MRKHRHIWKNKKILREIYSEWYKLILANIKTFGTTVELGSGIGNFKEFAPNIIATDIVYAEWLDLECDGHNMPFRDESIDNIVMIDVLHHMGNPVGFFNEALRVLRKGGRIIMLEPYGSPLSLVIYRIFHEEPFLFDKDYFASADYQDKDPWESNQAIAQLLFFRNEDIFKMMFQEKLKLLKKIRLSYILYPLSGGFDHKSLIPYFMVKPLRILEKLLVPFGFFFAFRCLIVLEKL